MPEGSETAYHILVVDDDERLRRLLSRFLTDDGLYVSTAADAAEARAHIRGLAFDLVVLDVMMPGESGFDLTVDLTRSKDAPPVLLLTARGEAEDRIRGLECGAEDYLPKPFEPRELLLRIRTILRRRAQPAEPGPSPVVALGDLRFDPGRQLLTRENETINLTETEAALLTALARAGGDAVTREDLARAIGSNGSERSVDVHVARLRRKIETDPRFPRHLQTARGRGYVLRTA